MMNSPLPLSVIVPVYDSETTIARCFTSVYSSDAPPNQVIVVDDGSTDGTAVIAATYPCNFIRTGQHRGAAAARNEGACTALSEILFFLDADIVIRPDALSRIARTFRERTDISALFGSYEKDTIPTNFVSVYKNLLHHYTHQISAADAATFCSGFGAVRTSVFRELGGFDQNQHALEDIEFGYRMHRAGYHILLDKTLLFTHAKRYSLIDLIKSDVLNRSIPWTKLMLRERIFRNDLNTKPNNVLSVVLAVLIAAVIPFALVTWAGAIGLLGVVLLFVFLNLSFYAFVFRERGLIFALETVPMNWFNYIYSGVGLLIGVLQYSAESSQKWLAKRAGLS